MLAEVSIAYRHKTKPSEMHKLISSEHSVKILRTIFDPDKIEYREEFVVLFLNRVHRFLGFAKISQGGTAGTIADPKMIFQSALLTNAHAIILAHNHPSGNIQPSEDDIVLTKKISQGAQLLDIKLVDHIIITSEGYYSFSDEGRL